MTNARRAIFLALVGATFAAFFVAQRLKNSPSAIQQFRLVPSFSPNQDGRKDRARVTFKLEQADDVTVAVVDGDGDAVRTLLDDRRIDAYTPIEPSLAWDGRDEAGRDAPDGLYRVRITLRRQGRSVIVPRSVRKDTRPPRPFVASIGPETAIGPEIVPRPDGRPAAVNLSIPGPPPDPDDVRAGRRRRMAKVLLFKTAPGTPRLVLAQELPDGLTQWTWDGTRDGRRASAGTYLVAIQSRDEAGNIGTTPSLDGSGLPQIPFGSALPGRGGITVRRLALQAPSAPVKARDSVDLFVDARTRRYTWALRRLGTPRPIKRGRGTRPRVRVRAPGGVSGVYLFEVRTRRQFARVPLIVQARRASAGTRAQPRGVLVVLPWLTWQGRNPVDDDGDGAADVLDRGVGARVDRVLAGDGLPRGFDRGEAPLLGWLDRTGRRYDLTTDAALAAGGGPPLTGHKGVLLAGDARWMPSRLRARLRAFVRRGGTVVSLGTDSLRRTVSISRRGRMVTPSGPKVTDLYGARLGAVVRRPTQLQNFDDGIELFADTGGLFGGVTAWEPTIAVGREAEMVANAVTPQGRSVIVAARFGKGLVIRPGLPDFTTRLTPDPAIAALMGRMWTLLSR